MYHGDLRAAGEVYGNSVGRDTKANKNENNTSHEGAAA
jgi:hypothetical protein